MYVRACVCVRVSVHVCGWPLLDSTARLSVCVLALREDVRCYVKMYVCAQADVQLQGLSMIVSNPPVHHGQADCFRVLFDLLHGAPARLRPGGLFVVFLCFCFLFCFC